MAWVSFVPLVRALRIEKDDIQRTIQTDEIEIDTEREWKRNSLNENDVNDVELLIHSRK